MIDSHEFSLRTGSGKKSAPFTATSVKVAVMLGQEINLDQRVLMSTTLSQLFAGNATFQTDRRVFDTNTNAGMHFIAFARDNLSSPYKDSAGNYWAYYIRGQGVGLALTKDGITFADQGMVLRPNPNVPDERTWNSFPSVWKDGRNWYMVTEMIGTPGTEEGGIGLATSADGRNWTKRGIIFDHAGGWERANVGTPYLMKKGAEWFLSYSGFDGTDVRIGMAKGTDLFRLTRANGGRPVIDTVGTSIFGGQAGKRSIIKEGGSFYMVYEVSSDKVGGDPNFDRSNYSSAVARSIDLVNWQSLGRAVLPTSWGVYGQHKGYSFDGPEWFRTSNGDLHIYYRVSDPVRGLKTMRSTLVSLPPFQPQTFQAESLLTQVGRREADGMATRVQDGRGYLTYGPYTTAVRPGQRTATFRLMIDNSTVNNDMVLTIDVFDAATGQRVVPARDLRRRDFHRAMTYQEFTIGFTAAEGQNLEIRVYSHGRAYVRQDFVRVS
jgi:hypothetical protein